MAKIRFGSIAGQVSGSIAGNVYSHNRYGSYVRTRTVPITVTSLAAMNAKARLTAASQGWKALTDAQRLAWVNWAQSNPIMDVLGEKQVLTGHAAYVKLGRRLLEGGQSLPTTPPTTAAPGALETITLTADIGAGAFQVAFTPTPPSAGIQVWVWAAVVESVGINYVKNLLRLVYKSAAAAASPANIETAMSDRFGTLQVGYKAFVQVHTFDEATGLISGPLRDEAVITSSV